MVGDEERVDIRSNTVVHVKHTSDTVETETIKLILVHPEAQVTQEEPQHFMMPIVEQTTIPKLMATLSTLVEIEMIGSIEHVQAIEHVLRCMTVHHIQQYHQPHIVGSVNQLLQILGGPVATACGKEIVHLVPEAGVVGVLHNGHQLDRVVAQVLDTREHVLGKFLVRGDPGVGRRDADVCLVDTQTLGLLGP